MAECKRLGIPFAVYIYSHADSDKHIQSEIAHTKRMCKGYEPVSYWLDLEERSTSDYWRKAAELWHDAFGSKAGVYSWKWAFEKHVRVGRIWICAYGNNTGKPEKEYKPTMPTMDGWQFTSRAVLSGIRGYVDLSEWYVAPFASTKPIEIKPHRRVVTKKEVAALIMRHLCTHNAHGYTQDMSGRQGTGTETIDVYGKKYTITQLMQKNYFVKVSKDNYASLGFKAEPKDDTWVLDEGTISKADFAGKFACVNTSGSILTSGTKKDGDDYKISLNKYSDKKTEIFAGSDTYEYTAYIEKVVLK